MKFQYFKFKLGFLFIILSLLATAQPSSLAIIPEPVSVEMGSGTFKITPKTSILFASTSKELSQLADLLATRLQSETPPKSVNNN